MRLSIDTLIFLAREGDAAAETTAVWWADDHRDAEIWTTRGRIGAGWPGTGGARRWANCLPVNRRVGS